MFVNEPSDAINAGMAVYNEGRRLALRASLRPQLDLWLVGWLLIVFKTLIITSTDCTVLCCVKCKTREYLHTLWNENKSLKILEILSACVMKTRLY